MFWMGSEKHANYRPRFGCAATSADTSFEMVTTWVEKVEGVNSGQIVFFFWARASLRYANVDMFKSPMFLRKEFAKKCSRHPCNIPLAASAQLRQCQPRFARLPPLCAA